MRVALFLFLGAIPFLLIGRLPTPYLIFGEFVLLFAAQKFLGKRASYLWIFLAGTVSFLLIGELVIRLDSFGVAGLNFERYTPEFFAGSESDGQTYTGLKARDVAFYSGETFTTDNDGFRGRALPKAKSPGVYRIVYVGASVGFGTGLPEDLWFTRQLETALNTEKPIPRRFEIINLSVPAIRYGGMLDALKTVGMGYSPDLVLFEVSRFGFRDYSKLTVKNEATEIVHTQPNFWRDLVHGTGGLKGYSFFLKRIYIFIFGISSPYSYPEGEQLESAFREVMGEARTIAANVPLFVFELPQYAALREKPAEAECHALMLRLCEELKLPFIDGPAIQFPGPDGDWMLRIGDSHPNGKASKVIADYLLKRLLELQPWKAPR